MIDFTRRNIFRPPSVRMSYEEFATTKIVVPDGPYAGERYNLSRQPYSRHWFKALDSGKYREFVGIKPTQSGGSLTFVMIPLVKHTFHDRHSNVFGIPDTNMAADKWSIDIKPIILKTQYADQLPKKGRGSQGGLPATFIFDGGGVIRFMAAGGGDGQRLSFTGQNLFITEADSLDAPGKMSVVTDKVSELEGRLGAYRESGQYRIFMECRPTVKTGVITARYETGTETVIKPKCQHCGEFVIVERENFHGWQDARSVEEARELGRFVCPVCAAIWSERERKNAVRESIAVNTRESVRFSYRVNAAHNFFVGSSDIAEAEWNAAQRPDRDNAERHMLQDWWGHYWTPSLAKDSLGLEILRERVNEVPRGTMRDDFDCTAMGVDVHNSILYWVIAGMNRESLSGAVVDYGRILTEDDRRGLEPGVIWACEQLDAMRREKGVRAVMCDEGWLTALVRRICLKHGWKPCKGYGSAQRSTGGGKFSENRDKDRKVVRTWPDGFGLVEFLDTGAQGYEHNSDISKTWVHERFKTPSGQPGHLGIFGSPEEHKEYFRQLQSEQYTEENGRYIWVKKAGVPNHYFDTTALAGLGLRLLGSLMEEAVQKPEAPTIDRRGRRSQWGQSKTSIRGRY